MKNWEFRVLCLVLLILSSILSSFAGVSRVFQDQYKKNYENKAMFLKVPIYAEKQMIYISGQSFRVEQGSGTPRYKVGDQLRVLAVDFSGEEIKFKMGGIATPGLVELGFKFDSSLQESFPNREVFDRALRSVLTEGLKYTDIDEAKDSFVQEQFDRAVGEISGSASISREAVLKNIASRLPAYQDAQREIDSLKDKIQEITAQLSQSQSENRKLETESRTQQAELSRLKSNNSALQANLENYTSQISKLGEAVRDAKGNAQGYQNELAKIQRSLNLRIDASHDVTGQIADLGHALKKLQSDNESFANQISSLQTNLQAQKAANAHLVGDNEELKADNRKLQTQISDLTSKGDSLAKRYYDLGNEKEKLDSFARAVNALRSRIVEESTAGGVYRGKADVYLKNVLLGSLDWSLPVYLNRDRSKSGQASFSSESIDYVRVTPEERHILRSFGERFKIRLDLSSGTDSIAVTPDQDKPTREIGERDRASWQWSIVNTGLQDSRLVLSARLVNKDSKEISLLQQEHLVVSSNLLRQIRGYLQPIPLAAGVVIGFVALGIVGIFRKPKSRIDYRKNPPANASDSGYIDKKQL
jgi:predicted nuclease with TOPRIM domain